MLNLDITNRWTSLVMVTFLIVVAIAGKVITGLRVFNQPQINHLAMSVDMISRGAEGQKDQQGR